MEIIDTTYDKENQTKTVIYKNSKINKVTHTFNSKGNLDLVLYTLCLDYLKKHEYID